MTAVVRVGTLDLARRTGWACDGDDAAGGVPLHGVWKLPSLTPENVDKANSVLFDLVGAFCRQHRLQVLVVEAINQGTVSQPGLGLGHKAFPTIACLAAFRVGGVRRYEVVTSTWRKHFTGRGVYAGGSPEAKRAAVAACKRLGWHCTDHNEAEALGIFAYAKAMLMPTWAPKTSASWSPLLAERGTP